MSRRSSRCSGRKGTEPGEEGTDRTCRSFLLHPPLFPQCSSSSAIPRWCVLPVPATVEGTRQDKIVLVQMRHGTDLENGHHHTVKRRESEKVAHGTSWRHSDIRLRPMNPNHEAIMLTGEDEGALRVVAKMIEVLGGANREPPVAWDCVRPCDAVVSSRAQHTAPPTWRRTE